MEQNQMVLRLMRVRENAVIPKQATAGSAGYDLCACIEAPCTIQPGERIAQMIIMPYFAPGIEEVTALTETDRGAGGFGSTGK